MNQQSLPISAYREEIIAAVKDNPVVILTAETGAGKSTQVPQYLINEGYNLVVTQPRRLAARTVAARVAKERNEELGGVVGFRTALERQDSKDTRCLFCTDGLALIRELMGAGEHNVLVLDEVHEWNLNIEVLVAWTKRQIESGADFKAVVMSATLESEKLSEFFGGAPVISVPGRMFPVEQKRPGPSELLDVHDLLKQGRNVLWFLPGKAEIMKAVGDLGAIPDLAAEVLPLHGELDASEQDRCFRRYGRPKCVLSTNVAQTSVTIDDIDAVVDSGIERRIELVEGVEGLYLKAISRADAQQRKGRAGRTKPGIYIDWYQEMDRLDFPKAEILRTRLDQTVLRLAEAGIDMEGLQFFHQPDVTEIHEARRALQALGCMDGRGRVTRIGEQIAKLPVSVQFGRMVIEAERLGVVEDVITVAAIMEQGELTARRVRIEDGRNVDAINVWRPKFCPREVESDVLAQLAVYNGARSLTPDEMRASGVLVKAYFQAREKRQRLANALRGKVRGLGQSSGNRQNILRAVCAGMVDHLWKYNAGRYMNGDGQARELARESVVRFGSYQNISTWLVGLPFDLGIKTHFGPKTLKLVRMVTRVDPAWLIDIAPQLVEKRTGFRPAYDPIQKTVVSMTEFYFNGQMVREESVPDPTHPDATRVYVEYLFSSFAKPRLTWVNVNDESVVIPAVQECIVGTHPETGEKLKMFGTYKFPIWGNEARDVWVNDREEAVALRNKFIDDMLRRQENNRRDREENERERAEFAEQERKRREEINRQIQQEEAGRREREVAVRREAEKLAREGSVPSGVSAQKLAELKNRFSSSRK